MRQPPGRHGTVRLRPVGRDEPTTLDAVFAGLSAASRRRRFGLAASRLGGALRRALVDVDGERHVAVVAEARVGRRWIPVGLARYLVDAADSAEIAYEVVDPWQGRGVGTRLVVDLAARARAAGLRDLRAYVVRDNTASLRVLRRVLPDQDVSDRGDVLEVRCRLAGASAVAAHGATAGMAA